jgi:hypothetical protein
VTENRAPVTRDLLGAITVGALAPVLGVASGQPWIFPVISTATFLPFFWRLVSRQTVPVALAVTLLWVAVHSVVSIALAHELPAEYERAVVHGAEYRAEMFHWLRTGEGAEGDPARFIPIHIMHFVAFALLAWITRGAAGLLLGALLLNYMNAYVGALSREGASWLLPFLGWHPWAVVRVIGFLLAAILLSRASPPSRWKNQAWGWVFGLLAADILLKWLLAPVWRVTIREQLNW